jgi:transcriptional regulator with XRE-family HTH domain
MVKNLRSLRIKKGLSQQQLGEIIGISQQSVNKYENHNIEPDISTLISLANFFNTSVDYLIGHTNIEHIIEPVSTFELNKDEASIMNEYRMLTAEEQQVAFSLMKNLNKYKNNDYRKK